MTISQSTLYVSWLALMPPAVVAIWLYVRFEGAALIIESSRGRAWTLIGLLSYVFILGKIVIPYFTSPLRNLPTLPGDVFGLGHVLSMFGDYSESLLLKASRTNRESGLMQSRDPITVKSRLFPTSPEALLDILNHRCYDFEKPGHDRDFLRRPIGNGLVVSEGSDHKKQRKAAWPAFRGEQIKALVPIFWSKAQEFVDVVGSQCQVDATVELGALTSRVTLDIIGAAGLGYDFKTLHNSGDELAQVYASLTNPSNPTIMRNYLAHFFLPRSLAQKFPFVGNGMINRHSRRLREICNQFVVEKRHALEMEKGASPNTILSFLLQSPAFTDGEIVDQLLTFLAAGHETTSSAFEWTLYMLAKHQDIQQSLRKEVQAFVVANGSNMTADGLEQMHYLNAVCMEVLRFWAVVPDSTRVAVCDTIIGRTLIPKGTNIDILPLLFNKSEELWGPDAEVFNPGRWLKQSDGGATSLYGFMTFLHGPRSCIGQVFAKMELKCLVTAFILRFQFEMANPDEVVLPAGIVTIKPKHGLHLRVEQLHND